MAKYRQRPVIVDAIQYVNTKEGIGAVLRFVRTPRIVGIFNAHLLIHTLEGAMRVYPLDWIIRGVQGEYFPVKNEIFIQTYELVTEAE
jgi:hypothetical protein